MLEKDFVPYEQALALRELGFDEPHFKSYVGISNNGDIKDCTYVLCNGKLNNDDVSAPTFSQAFRWLLKHYNLYGVIIPTITMNWTFKTMTVVEDIMEVPPYKHIDANDYKTPEEAELACLDKLIEIVKNK